MASISINPNDVSSTHYLLSDIEYSSDDKLPLRYLVAHKLLNFITIVLCFALFLSENPSNHINTEDIDWQSVESQLMPAYEPPRSSSVIPEEHLSSRIISYLVRAESKETNAWKVDDYRVSRMAVALAYKGTPDPWGFAFWSYYGKTLPKALEAWAERDAYLQACLERVAANVAAEEFKKNAPPKKPMQVVRLNEAEEAI